MNTADDFRAEDEGTEIDRLLAAAITRNLPLPFVTTAREFEVSRHHRRGLTLDQVLAEEMEEVGEASRAIWHGTHCVAVIQSTPGGPVLHRIPAPAASLRFVEAPAD